LIMSGPNDALKSGFAGDLPGFKSHFTGAGATAPDSEAQAFIDQLRARYGEFTSCTPNQQNGSSRKPQPGQAQVVMAYVATFSQATVDANVELIFADPNMNNKIVKKLGSITVVDATNGDLTYPASASSTVPSATKPSTGRRTGAGKSTTSSPSSGGQ